MRLLKANEIECRVGTMNSNGLSLLLYKDARCDMNILDEEFGEYNWMRDHKELKGNIYCGVSIWFEERQQWITKWDCGSESKTEAEKGEASDSFKRACVNWGIGRELYSSPFIWIPKEMLKIENGKPKSRFRVEAIEYNEDRTIKSVTISVDGRAKVFSNEQKSIVKTSEEVSKVSGEQKENLIKLATSKGYSEKAILNQYKISDIFEMDIATYNKCIAGFLALPDKE